ncbi:MAG: glycosyltransferase [Armatimonadetes bacterium]|nr:glycosyltransferase [Armatimonadota bacterium]
MACFRIFHLIKSLGRGGAEVLLSEARPYRSAQFEDGYGYFLPWKNAIVPALEATGAEVVCFESNGLMLPLRIPRVIRHLKRRGVDLLHCHLPLAAVVGRIAARAAGIPSVYTEHNLMKRYHPVTRWLNLLTWRMQDLVIAVSSEVAAEIRRYVSGGPPVEVVPNGVCLRSFSPDPQRGRELRSALGIPPDAPVIGTVAVFRVQKQLDLWLEAARRIRERFSNAHFILVGDGVMREEIGRVCRRLELTGCTHFPGLQEDVRPYYDCFDVFLMTSKFEGLPVALLEAMAMKKAVVASPVGGTPEVIEDGSSGVLVSPEGAADSVCRLLSDAQQSMRLGENARAVVERSFSLQAMVSKSESLYHRILETRRPRC